jgi:hypothetical protein
MAAFERVPGFVEWVSDKRAVDATTSAFVRNPHFDTTESMVAAQLYVVYGVPPDAWTPEGCPADAVMFPQIGAALQDESTKYTALQFGLVIQRAGYGPGYGTDYAKWYATVRNTLRLFLNYVRDGGPSLASDVATEASQWAIDALDELPQS